MAEELPPVTDLQARIGTPKPAEGGSITLPDAVTHPFSRQHILMTIAVVGAALLLVFTFLHIHLPTPLGTLPSGAPAQPPVEVFEETVLPAPAAHPVPPAKKGKGNAKVRKEGPLPTQGHVPPLPAQGHVPVNVVGGVKHDPPVVHHPPVHTTKYTVHAGDTLARIAAADHTTWQAVYKANQTTIDSEAKAHHETPDPHDGYAHWIFPGEQLTLPS